jgi:hypothetical protein
MYVNLFTIRYIFCYLYVRQHMMAFFAVLCMCVHIAINHICFRSGPDRWIVWLLLCTYISLKLLFRTSSVFLLLYIRPKLIGKIDSRRGPDRGPNLIYSPGFSNTIDTVQVQSIEIKNLDVWKLKKGESAQGMSAPLHITNYLRYTYI